MEHNGALRSITEVTITLFLCLIMHWSNSNIDKFAQNFASGFIASVHFFSFLFRENRPSTAANIVQISGALRTGGDKVLPPFKLKKNLILLL